MSKRYKGKDCVYCGGVGSSETADHVFAREFFRVEHRRDLPKVPACRACNGSKSVLEHYLTAVLPFAGSHPDSQPLLTEEVPRRLERNRKLWLSLAAGRQYIDLDEAGASKTRMALPFDGDKLIGLVEYWARALTFHHWNLVIPQDHAVRASLVNPQYEPILEKLFRMRGAAYARGGPGNFSFRYEGQQAVDHPGLTLWRFQIYNGIQLGGDEQAPGVTGSNLWACSTPPGVENLLIEPD